MKRVFLIIGLCFTSFLYSQDEPLKLSREGEIYFEAGDIQRAEETYRRMLRLELPDWQKTIVTQNHGAALTSLGRLDDALTTFRTIPLGHDPFPRVLLNLDYNSAVIRVNQATLMSQTLQDPDSVKEDRYKDILQGLSEAFNRISAASKINCEIARLEGASSCVPSEKISGLERIIKQQKARLTIWQRAFQLRHPELNQGIVILLLATREISKQLEVVQRASSQTWKEQYLALLANRTAKITELWQSLQQQIKDPVMAKELKTAFDSFQAAKASIEKKSLDVALGHLSVLINLLDRVQKELLGENNIILEIHELLDQYQLVLAEDPLQLSSLMILEDSQEVLLSKSKDKQKVIIQNSLSQLQISKKKLLDRNDEGAHLYLMEANYLLNLATGSVDPSDPIQILKSGLDAQRQALSLDQYLELHRSADVDIHQLILLSQIRTLENVKSFLAASVAKQQELFDNEKICTREPWNQVIPLFTEGYNDALDANKRLSKKLQAIDFQERVIRNWERALDLLEQDQSSQSKENQQKQQQKEKTRSAGITPNPTKPEDVIKLLQEMELEDRQLKSPTEPTDGGGPPW